MQTLAEVQAYLWSMIGGMEQKPRGTFGYARMQHLCRLLGDPQEQYPVIHIAGTSGKGSVAVTTSKVLAGHDLRVGLHVSPHLLDFRERMQVVTPEALGQDFVLVDEDVVFRAMETVVAGVNACRESFFGEPTFFEVMAALSYVVFAQQQVDVTVVEVGCGGLLDGTNVVQKSDKLSVITRQGFDHEQIVGDTLEQIIFQDMGIVPVGGIVVSLWHEQDVCREVVVVEAERKEASVVWVKESARRKAQSGKEHKKDEKDCIFTFLGFGEGKHGEVVTEFAYMDRERTRRQLQTSLLGAYQAENVSLALCAVEEWLIGRGRKVDWGVVQDMLAQLSWPGRFSVKEIKGKIVLLDGAHNPQKMAALVASVQELYGDKMVHVVTAFKQRDDESKAAKMLQLLCPLASAGMTVTNFVQTQYMTFCGCEKALYERLIGDDVDWNYIDDVAQAMERALVSDAEVVVVTGSLYLMSGVYELFDDI